MIFFKREKQEEQAKRSDNSNQWHFTNKRRLEQPLTYHEKQVMEAQKAVERPVLLQPHL